MPLTDTVMKPVWQHALDNNGDSDTSITVYDRPLIIKDLLATLGLSTDNRASFNEDEPGVSRRSGYVDSGLWWYHGTRNRLEITVDVGCSCSHDCCGHLCGLSYEITLTDGFIIVITHRSFNY